MTNVAHYLLKKCQMWHILILGFLNYSYYVYGFLDPAGGHPLFFSFLEINQRKPCWVLISPSGFGISTKKKKILSSFGLIDYFLLRNKDLQVLKDVRI